MMIATKKNWAVETVPHTTLDEALFRAVLASDVPALVAILDAPGANPNIMIHGQTPLHAACRVHGQGASRGLRRSPATVQVIEILLAAGADPTVRGSLGYLPAAWCEGDTPACLRQRMEELAASQTWPEPNPSRQYEEGELMSRMHKELEYLPFHNARRLMISRRLHAAPHARTPCIG